MMKNIKAGNIRKYFYYTINVIIFLFSGIYSHAYAHSTGSLHIHNNSQGAAQPGPMKAAPTNNENNTGENPANGKNVLDTAPREAFAPLPHSGPRIWSTPATLFVQRCINDLPPSSSLPGLCGNKPVSNIEKIIWGKLNDIDQAVVSTSGTIRLGPFSLKRQGAGKARNTSDTYVITVYSRSPAIYGPGPNGQADFLGASHTFKPIGFLETTLKGNDERVVYVTVKLPSVFNAIKIVARVGNKKATFPADCKNLPSSSSNPSALDSKCLQATVNPLALLNIPYIPLAIIYEPPGNCSWSNLTNSNTSGAKLSISRVNSTSSRTISDSGFFWDVESQDITRGDYTGSDSSITMSATWTGSLGTRLAGSFTNPGNDNCKDPGAEVPARVNAGPGYGEVFLLLRNENFLYWDTDDFTGMALSPIAIPGKNGRVMPITAHTLRTGEGLPPGITFSEEERDAILSLSLFSIAQDGEVLVNLNSDRFLQIGQPYDLPIAQQIEHKIENQISVATGQSLTSMTQAVESSSESDFAVDLSMAVLQRVSSAAASSLTGNALTGLNDGFKETAEGIELDIPTLYTDQSTTTTTITFSNNERIDSASSNAVTQQFFLQDTTKGMSVSIYYDRLFGTYAFVPHLEDTGMSNDPSTAKLPAVVWKTTEQSMNNNMLTLPGSIRNKLTSFGATNIDPVPGKNYRSLIGYSKARMTSKVSLNSSNAELVRLSPADNQPARKMQTLYIARDKNGNAVAQLWISTD